MRILVLGAGAREHAILWKLSQSVDKHELFVCPGNVGMDNIAHRLIVQDRYSIEEYAVLASQHGIDLTVVGSENELVNGIVDHFQDQGLKIFGPTANAARLEGSKVWAKEIMQRVGIPTATWRSYDNYEHARLRARELKWQCVLKADGLAAGKGSFVCHDEDEVDLALEELAQTKDTSSAVILVEELLEGQEVSVFAISDGRTVIPFGAAQDHKRLRDGDEGPNTGGMGAYSPVNHMLVAQGFADSFFQPLVTSLRALDTPYVGVLYAGAIVTSEGPKILEFNCRFGDPEAEVLLRRLDSDLAGLLIAATDESLHTMGEPRWSPQEALCVVAAGRRYPREYDFAKPITGLEAAEQVPGVIVFHAGTQGDLETGQISTNGGRILCVTAIGRTLDEAHDRAYEGLRRISFDGMQYRSDIGTKALPYAWETRWRKPPRWEMQMRAVTGGLDSVASAIHRIQLSGPTESATSRELQDIRQRLYDLKLQTVLPEDRGHGAGLQLTWALVARYAEQLAASTSTVARIRLGPNHRSADGDDDGRVELDIEPSATPSLDVLSIPLKSSSVRFERHDNYDLLAWDSSLMAGDALIWLEKQRDAVSAFYIDTNSFMYEFDSRDTDVPRLLGEPPDEIKSIRLETSSYTCIWGAANGQFHETGPTFAILSQALLVEDVWWFVKGSSSATDAEEFRELLSEVQELAEDSPGLLEVD